MNATIDREAREHGVAVIERSEGMSVEELSRTVMRRLGIEGDDGLRAAAQERAT